MRGKLLIASAISTAMMVAGPNIALAQHGGGGGGGGGIGGMSPGMQMPRAGTGDLDRTRDQDRLKDKTGDRASDRDKDRDRDRDQDKQGGKDQDRERDQDRLHTAQAVEDQLSSWNLLTGAERARFHSEMRAAKTVEERNRIRSEHQKMIQDRAQAMGIAAPFGAGGGTGAGAGGGMGAGGAGARGGYVMAQLLTDQERSHFYERLRLAKTEQERQTIRNEMHVTARERATEMGVDVPVWFGTGPGPR